MLGNKLAVGQIIGMWIKNEAGSRALGLELGQREVLGNIVTVCVIRRERRKSGKFVY